MSKSNIQSVSIKAARNLTNTSLTTPTLAALSPRLLLKLLPWREVPGGFLRINRTKLIFGGKDRIPIEFSDKGPVVTPEALGQIPMFKSLEDGLLKKMSTALKMEQVATEEVLIKEGEDRDKLFILAEGSAECLKTGNRGQELQLKIFGPGDFFGEDELVADVKAAYSVRCLSNCVFITLSKNELTGIFKSKPELKKQFEEHIEKQLELKAQANEYGEHRVRVKAGHLEVEELPNTFVDYIEDPEEVPIVSIETVLKVHTKISDLYNNPMSQLQMQINITMAYMYESQESAIINDPKYGLIAKCRPDMKIQPKYGTPTPDDLDNLLSLVWKRPSFFVAHPRAIAAFGRECTFRGTPPPTTEIDGQQVITWRGVPLIPSDKIKVDGQEVSRQGSGTTSILLIRIGQEDVQGVTGIYQTEVPGEVSPGLSVRQMGIDQNAIASYLMNLYYNIAVLTDDAIAILENVEVGYYHTYAESK